MDYSKLSDKERIEFALGSIKLVSNYLNGVSEDKFYSDFKIQDAIQYRMCCIGNAIESVSKNLKEKYSIHWELYIIFRIDDAEVIFELKQKDNESNVPYESLKSLYNILFEVYSKEYTDLKEVHKNDLVTDYKYPIKTKNSIWTVKNK